MCVEGVGVGPAPALQESRVGWVEPGVEPRCTHHMKLSRAEAGLSADLEPWDWNPGGRKGEAGGPIGVGAELNPRGSMDSH